MRPRKKYDIARPIAMSRRGSGPTKHIDPKDPLKEKEAYRSFQHSDGAKRAGKREFASHAGARKGSRRSLSVSDPEDKRDRLPRERVFRFRTKPSLGEGETGAIGGK